MVFGLWTALGGHGAPGIELAYNVRSPGELAAVLEEAERAGATIVRPAARAEWGGMSGAFADPDGYVWEPITLIGRWPRTAASACSERFASGEAGEAEIHIRLASDWDERPGPLWALSRC